MDRLYACPPTVPIAAIETISAEQQPEKPLSHAPPKLLGTSGPATYGLRTSTKYAISLAKAPARVNEPQGRNTRWVVLADLRDATRPPPNLAEKQNWS